MLKKCFLRSVYKMVELKQWILFPLFASRYFFRSSAKALNLTLSSQFTPISFLYTLYIARRFLNKKWMELENKLQGCSYENTFPVVAPLNWEKIQFPRVHIRNISPAGQDLFWWAFRWENFPGNQDSKCVTQTWRKIDQLCCIWIYQGLILSFYVWWDFTIY